MTEPRTPDFHGWSRSYFYGGPDLRPEPSLHIGELPGRKSVCLYRVDGSVLKPLAYFRSREDAQSAMELLDALILGERR